MNGLDHSMIKCIRMLGVALAKSMSPKSVCLYSLMTTVECSLCLKMLSHSNDRQLDVITIFQ